MKFSEFGTRAKRSRSKTAPIGLMLLGLLVALTLANSASSSSSSAKAAAVVPLGTAQSFAILAGSAISDTNPPSTIIGNVGLSPATGANITGLTCASVTGVIYAVDAAGPAPCAVDAPALVGTAKNDLTAAYLNAAAQPPDTVFAAGDNQLGGKTLVPGVYQLGAASTANLIGNLTLSGDGNSVWVFQATSTLVTASASSITLTGGAQACNVFWQVTSSATLNSGSSFVGTIMALTSISVFGGVTIDGRVLARNAAVTIAGDSISAPGCAPTQGIPSREIYCDPSGKAYDLVIGQNLQPPYNTLGLVDAYVDPVTGSKSCNFPAVVPTATTPTATTPTATTPTPTPLPTPKPVKPKPTPKPVVKVAAVKAVTAVPTPSPARHPFGLTG
jgi:hypothetical protein